VILDISTPSTLPLNNVAGVTNCVLCEGCGLCGRDKSDWRRKWPDSAVFRPFGKKIRHNAVPVNVSRETGDSSPSLCGFGSRVTTRGADPIAPRFHPSIHKVIHSDIHWVMHRVMHRSPRGSASADCCRNCNVSTQAHHCGSPPDKWNDQSEALFRSGQWNKMTVPHPNRIVVTTSTLWAAAMMAPDPDH
jgi:hypothetical protein